MIERHVDAEGAHEGALGIEHLDAPVEPVRHVDVPLRVGGDAVRGVELAGLIAAVAPRLDPVARLVDLGDARIYVPVADEDVALRIPGHVGDLPEAAVLGGKRRLRVLQGRGVLVGRLELAPEHQRDAALGIELDDHVRSLVRDQMLSWGSIRTVWANDQAYRLWPISRRNLPL